MSSKYHCFCKNSVAVVNAKFRAFDSSGQKGKKIELPTGGEGQLALLEPAGNIIKIEYWDVDWQDRGCFGPVNSGDEIVIDGSLSGFKVTINGNSANTVPCPGS